MTMWRAF